MENATTKRDQRRIAILKSAAAAFRRRGYHGASVDEIARALNMTKGNLYYYFRDKEAILYACHQYSADILLDLLNNVERSVSAPDEKLRRLIGGFVHLLLDELHGTALTIDVQALSPRRLRAIVAKRDKFDHAIRRILQEGMSDGIFAPGDPKLIAFAILGAVNWIPRWFDPRGAAKSTHIAESFAEYLVSGLLRGRPDASRG